MGCYVQTNIFVTRDQFCGRQFFHRPGNGLGMIQAHYICCVLYFYCYYISSISWQIYGETLETVTGFILGGSKITADGDCSHEIKRCLLLGRKVMTNLDSILKSRDITLPKKVCLVKAIVFPVVMYGCESWTIWRLSAEELMLLNYGVGEDSWESLGLQGDPTSPFWRRSTRGFKGMMLKLKLQYFGHLMRRVDSLEKTLMLGKIESGKRREQKMR